MNNTFFSQFKKEAHKVRLNAREREDMRRTLERAINVSDARPPERAVPSPFFFFAPRVVASFAFVLVVVVFGGAMLARPGDENIAAEPEADESLRLATAVSKKARGLPLAGQAEFGAADLTESAFVETEAAPMALQHFEAAPMAAPHASIVSPVEHASTTLAGIEAQFVRLEDLLDAATSARIKAELREFRERVERYWEEEAPLEEEEEEVLQLMESIMEIQMLLNAEEERAP